MPVPFTFGTATAAIPLSQLDTNFATAITLGNTAMYLGNTTTSVGNLTLTNVTISSGTANVTANITYGTANAVVYSNASNVGVTSANLTFNGTTLTSTGFAGPLNGTVGATTANTGAFTTLSASGTVTFTGLSASQAVFTDASDNLVSNAITGTGNVVMSASPTLTGTISAAAITASGTITGNGNWVLGNADTDTITVGASYINGTALRSAKVATNTLNLAAYDVDGTAYTNLITLTASNTPTLTLTSTGVGTIDNMSIGATTASTGAFTTVSASGVATFSAGTVSLPAITTTGDTNTGIFFPAADTIAFTEGGAESMRIDASGNLGIGTSSPQRPLHVLSSAFNLVSFASSGAETNIQIQNTSTNGRNWSLVAGGSGGSFAGGNFGLYDTTAASVRLTVDSSGNVGVGAGAANLGIELLPTQNTIPAAQVRGYIATGNSGIGTAGDLLIAPRTDVATSIRFITGTTPTERMRIDSSGNLLVGATATSNGGKFLVAQPTAASQSAVFQSTNATAGNNYGILVAYTAASPNGTSNSFVYCSDSTQLRAEFRSNGGLANFSANDANLSDARTKTDIQDAGSYLAKICAIPVRTFKYKDQTDDLLNLGCIAQEVETVAPELVDVSGFGKTPDDGVPLKAIYQTDLQYALMKCIQEQQALIQDLTTRLAALEAK